MDDGASTGEQVPALAWDDFIGQEKLKARLQIHIEATIMEDREMDHVLLEGPPGVGKTLLARLIADELGDRFHLLMMSPRVKEKDFIYFCSKDFAGGGVLLLDEIHSAPKAFQEMLLTAIQDGYVQASSGRKVPVNHITFIAATTEPEKVIKPLWDRFLIKPEWEPYTDDEMARIVAGMAKRAGVKMAPEIAQGLARAAGGTPRIAGALVVACRSLVAIGRTPTVESILDLADLDVDGLTSRHLSYLRCLSEEGDTAGLSTLCSMLQMSQTVVMDLERLLRRREFIRKDSTGRILTEAGRAKVAQKTDEAAPRRRRRAA